MIISETSKQHSYVRTSYYNSLVLSQFGPANDNKLNLDVLKFELMTKPDRAAHQVRYSHMAAQLSAELGS